MPQLLILVVILFLVIVPPVLVLISKRGTGNQKFLWFIAACLFSWLGYIGFRIATKNQITE